MSEYMTCPLCQQNDWQVIAHRDFKKSDINTLSTYHQNMYHFMFEVWHPTKSVITFKNLYCSCCGFICFYPRPTIEILHRFFQRKNEEPTVGYHPQTNINIANRRSKILYDYIARHHNLQNVQRILDYSGSDGNLMRLFLDNGKACFLTDFCSVTMSGVTKLGNTVADLKPEDEFDLIVCSHIIEHVVDPRETIKRLLGHLSDRGIIYVEVPLELWKRPPLLTQIEPITHLNYFTCNSLRSLFVAADVSVNKCELIEYLHTDGNWNSGIRCIGQKRDKNTKPAPLSIPDGLDFLKPGLKTYLRYYLGNRRKLKRKLAKRIYLRSEN